MTTCTIETGLLRKKPCGHAAVAACLNCEQPLCVEHAVAQTNDNGQRTGKFMCKECLAAAKAHARSMEGVARTQEARKAAAFDKMARDHLAHPPEVKPAAKPAPHTPAQPAAEAEPPKSEPSVLEFTPSKK